MSAAQDDTQLWMVPYADLMSMLVILFMALFAYAYSMKAPELDRTLANVELNLQTSKPEQARSRLEEADLAIKLRDEMGRLGLTDFGLQVTTRRIRLTLPAPVLFREGSASLEPQAKPVLDAVAALLAGAAQPVLVEGHTDSLPIVGGRYRTNWELSAARAFSVVERFIQLGLPASRFGARGYAEHRPAAANDTAEGRRTNRRIEISLLRESREEVAAP